MVFYIIFRVVLVISGLVFGYQFFRKNFTIRKKAALATSGIMLIYGLVTYGITALLSNETFGWSALILTPLLNGMISVFTYRYFLNSLPELSPLPAFKETCLILPSIIVGLQLIFLFVGMFEGTICIVIALPFLWLGSVLGALAAYAILQSRKPPQTLNLFLPIGLLTLLPLITQPLENQILNKPLQAQVTTNIIVNAPPEKVFSYVTQFSPISHPNRFKRPSDLLFLMGLPAPIQSTLACNSQNCARKCLFTQNIYLNEKVTRYNPGKALAFDVISVVGPQNRITGVDTHIMPGGTYFDNRKGQFLLEPIGTDKTLIKGTTWYTLHSSISWYAQPWAELMLHAIHNRVLEHIKSLAES